MYCGPGYNTVQFENVKKAYSADQHIVVKYWARDIMQFSPHIDYQFVYVGKEIEILGTSSYFRFAVPFRLAPDERNVDTPSGGAVEVSYPPSIVPQVTNIARKIVAARKSSDIAEQSNRVDQLLLANREMYRVSMEFGSFITDKVPAHEIEQIHEDKWTPL